MIKKLGTGNFCNEGVVLPNNDAVYCTIHRIEGQDTDKSTIYKKSDNQEKAAFAKVPPRFSLLL